MWLLVPGVALLKEKMQAVFRRIAVEIFLELSVSFSYSDRIEAKLTCQTI